MQVSAKYIQFQMTEYYYMTTLFNSEAETLLHSAPSSGRHGFSPAWSFNRSLPLLSIFNIDLKQNNCKQQFFLLTGNTTNARSEHTLLWARDKNKTSNQPLKSAGKKEITQNMQGKIIQNITTVLEDSKNLHFYVLKAFSHDSSWCEARHRTPDSRTANRHASS